MSVVGIDIGTKYCCIAQAKRGGIDIILNEASKRLNSTLVAFNGKERFTCEAAAPQAKSNYKNTVSNIKRLIGRKFSEASVQEDIANFVNFKVVPLADDEIGIEVQYNDQTTVFTPQQCLAMVLTKLVDIANAANSASKKVADVVLSVPAYFTDAQRHAMLDATRIAGVNCLRLLNEPTAAALGYGIFKSAKGEFSDTEARKVMFVDMGDSSYNVCVVSFLQGKLQVLSCVSNSSLGGRNVDLNIAKWLAEEFKRTTSLETWDNPKIRIKFMEAAEKLKKTLSPEGVPMANCNLECVKNDRDLRTKLTVEKFEELCQDVVGKLEAPITQALEMAGITDPSDLYAVELVGGGMRPRFIKKRVAEVLGIKGSSPNYGLSTTLNMDECIARGCALQCAILSPLFRIAKEFKVGDCVQFPVRLSWDEASTGGDAEMDLDDEPAEGGNNGVTLYRAGSQFPKMRRITFRRNTGIALTAEYEESKQGTPLPVGSGGKIGQFAIAPPSADCLPSDGSMPKIRINFNYDLNGIFNVHSAQVFKELPPEPEPEPTPEPPAADAKPEEAAASKDEDVEMKPDTEEAAKDTESKTEAEAKPEAEAAATPKADAKEEKAAKKPKFQRINLSVDQTGQAFLTEKQLNDFIEKEALMQQQDRLIRETQAKRNELETYIYDSRNAMYDLGDFVEPQDAEAIGAQLRTSEDWLYEDGFDAEKKVYQAKVDELRKLVEPIKARKFETENRPAAIRELYKVFEEYRGIANSTEDRLAHLTDEDRNTIRNNVKQSEDWLQSQLAAQEKQPLTKDVVVSVNDIAARKAQLRRECNPIANKPKPAPKKEEPKKEEGKKDEKAADTPAAEAAAEGESKDAAPEAADTEKDMEVDD